ncbi:MAG: hypothetical protein V8R63_05980 [Thomasclavelia ramosa]
MKFILKPHLMEYQSGDYVIHQNINIVYEDGIDEYTKARMNEVLAIKKMLSQMKLKKIKLIS